MGIEDEKGPTNKSPQNIETARSHGAEVVKIPVFEYSDASQREHIQKILNIPIRYPAVADAYRNLSNDPQLKEGVTPTYGAAPDSSYDQDLKTTVRRTNPIEMAYLLHTIGADTFGAIVSAMDREHRQKTLQAILKGETGAIFDLFLTDDTRNLSEGEPLMNILGGGSRETRYARGLAAVIFKNMPDKDKLNAIQLSLSNPNATLEDAATMIRERFVTEAKLRKSNSKMPWE